MADRSSGEQTATSSKAAIKWDVIFGVVGHYLWDLFKEHMSDKLVANSKDKVTFYTAMHKLKTKNVVAWQTINHFLQHHPLTEEDREHFMSRAARIGGDDLGPTVQFLEDIGTLPDHNARELALVALHVIGPQSRTINERAMYLLEQARDGMISGSTTTTTVSLKYINDHIAELKALGPATKAEAEQNATNYRANANNRLADALANLKK